MNTPEEKGSPIVQTVRTVKTEVRMVMTGEQVRTALTDFIMKKFKQFRGLDLEFLIYDEDDLEIEIVALKETETKE